MTGRARKLLEDALTLSASERLDLAEQLQRPGEGAGVGADPGDPVKLVPKLAGGDTRTVSQGAVL